MCVCDNLNGQPASRGAPYVQISRSPTDESLGVLMQSPNWGVFRCVECSTFFVRGDMNSNSDATWQREN